MTTLRERADREVLRFLVARTVCCPLTGAVLDVDHVAALRRRSDGEALAVISPEAAAGLAPQTVVRFAARGIVIDGRPVEDDRERLAAGGAR